MDWGELQAAVRALRADRTLTATEVARAGSVLLQRTLAEIYLGEPQVLRSVVRALVAARPESVSLRNVGVAVLATSQEAPTGDRMAAAERSARRLANLLEVVPAALGRRARPLLEGTVLTIGYSSGVHAALLHASDRIQRAIVLEGASPGNDGRLAKELQDQGMIVESRPVSESQDALTRAHVVLLGCYALLADGSATVSAEAGAVARMASVTGMPVHIMADTLKLAPWLPPESLKMLDLEQVPPERIDRVVTEDGIRQPRQLLAEAADLARRWRGLEAEAEERLLI